jgi:putative ABC transport system ATP-binding protein
VLLLDEPTASLDPASSQAIEALVGAWFATSDRPRASVWVSHDPAQAQRMSDRRLTMLAGTLGDDPHAQEVADATPDDRSPAPGARQTRTATAAAAASTSDTSSTVASAQQTPGSPPGEGSPR